jgi:tRNA(Arg) A34 adenosine deaminase TadA
MLLPCGCCRGALVPCRYGFVVYADPNVTDVACAGLNGLKMGDRTLTVRRAAEVGHQPRATASHRRSSSALIAAVTWGCFELHLHAATVP